MTDRIPNVALLVCLGCGSSPAIEPDAPVGPATVALTIEADGITTSYVSGPALHLRASAELADQSHLDVTDQATWSVPDNVQVSAPGELVPLAAGPATITASFDGVEATFVVRVAGGTFVVVPLSDTLGSVMVYEANADGAATPLRTFRSRVAALAPVGVDVVDGELFLASRDDIQVFDEGADGAFEPQGAVVPKRRIAGTDSQIAQTVSITVRGAEIFTANGRILVHAIDADGASPPLRRISGSTRGYDRVQVIGNELYAGSVSGQIDVFSASASGTPTPIRTIDTGISGLSALYATANELFVAHVDSQLRVYDAHANGAVSPLRTLETPALPRSPCVIGGELYILQPQDHSYLVYDVDAQGAATPLRKVTDVGAGVALEVR